MKGFTYLVFVLGVAGMLAACHEKEKKGNNKITITPSTHSNSQDKQLPSGLDPSPMDMSFYPHNYPILKMQNKVKEPPVARVIYSRPQRNGRTIFNDLLPYGKIWRLGANEATEIEFFRDVTIQDRKIPKGRYILYCVPHENNWDVVLNSDLYSWGLKIDTTKDLDEFNIAVSKTNFPFEVFTMDFEDMNGGMQLVMEWDSVRATLPIKF